MKLMFNAPMIGTLLGFAVGLVPALQRALSKGALVWLGSASRAAVHPRCVLHGAALTAKLHALRRGVLLLPRLICRGRAHRLATCARVAEGRKHHVPRQWQSHQLLLSAPFHL